VKTHSNINQKKHTCVAPMGDTILLFISFQTGKNSKKRQTGGSSGVAPSDFWVVK